MSFVPLSKQALEIRSTGFSHRHQTQKEPPGILVLPSVHLVSPGSHLIASTGFPPGTLPNLSCSGELSFACYPKF